MAQNNIKFTVITSTLNAADMLQKTAQSLQAQTYQNIEWIIVDGASTDHTAAVVKAVDGLPVRFISEPDKGIYDAWNKALPLITGEWVIFLGAGDTFHAANTLGLAARRLDATQPECTTAYGDVAFVCSSTFQEPRVYEEVWHGVDGHWKLGCPVVPHNAAAFHHASSFMNGFRYDARLKITADTELLLRELLAGRGMKLPLIITDFESGGISSRPDSRLRMVCEYVYINCKLGLFFRRPFYQVGMVCANVVRHALLKLGWLKR